VGAFKESLRRLFRGEDADLPQQCALGTPDPQAQVRVWLRGPAGHIDVTDSHSLACGAPFKLGVYFDSGTRIAAGEAYRLHMHAEDTQQTLLGEVSLECEGAIEAEGTRITLFGARGFRNLCLPAFDVWRQYAFFTYQRWNARHRKASDEVKPTWLAFHCMTVLFICPRPVVLVSVAHQGRFNMFPMNLMANAPDGHFVFALNSHRKACPLILDAGRLTICSVPVDKASDARALARNHRAETIDEKSLTFGLRRSPNLGLPVPEFATRIRELEVVYSHNLGSHTLVMAKITHDERWEQRAEFFMIHGIYQTWRRRHGLA
jgi:flavin reductase (DIM6/NTAB) family NADH-FMN oxidoreductase RutF